MPAESAVRDGNAADFQLIETLRWEPVGGFIRLERHLARLYASAHELGFACDPQSVGAALATVAFADPRRVRVALTRDGDVSIATQPFEPLAANAIWTLRIATVRLDASDPLLAHKTTRREIYATARSEFPVGEADEVLLLNENGMVCEGAITSLFVSLNDGPVVTPTLACGLLPGVLRGALLESGKAVEARVLPEDIRRANAVFVGNSLRGLIRARLLE